MERNFGLVLLISIIIHVAANSSPEMCRCPMLKQVDAEIYAQMRGTPGMSSDQIPDFAPLDVDYGNNCTTVTITCIYPRFTRHRSSIYYANGANFSTVRRYDLADKYSIRCNQMTGVWLSEENSEISYIQCAYRPMLVNRIVTGTWEEIVRFWRMVGDVLKKNFGFFKFIIGYD